MYKKAIRKLLKDYPTYATMRLYLYLSSKQTFQKCVLVTAAKAMEDLNMAQSTYFEAVKWLVEHDYMQRYVVDGVPGWLINPNVSGCVSKSVKSKKELWALGEKKKAAALEEDIKKRQALLETLDQLIAKNVSEDEEYEFDEEAVTDEYNNRYNESHDPLRNQT